MELRWQLNVDVSCFHAVDLVARGQPLADQQLEKALAEPTAHLLRLIEYHNLPQAFFFANLIPVSSFADSSRQLASVVLTKTGAEKNSAVQDRFSEAFADLKAAFLSVHPALLAGLARQVHTLQEDWQQRGQFVMQTIGELTEENVLAPQADVILVHPAQTGGGAAHLLFNSVRMELISPESSPPHRELLRLVWLLSQLNVDLPMFQGEIHRDRLVEIAAFAMLPPVVTAAAKTDLLHDNEQTLVELITSWEIPAEQSPADLGPILAQWWQAYVAAKPRWSVALAALDRML